jgi:hypothetical protein
MVTIPLQKLLKSIPLKYLDYFVNLSYFEFYDFKILEIDKDEL